MAKAARLYQSGDLATARALCDEILRSDARHFYALHLAAAIALREARAEDTVRLASRALELEPDHADVLSNRGAALRMMCRFEEALADYDRSLSVQPARASTLGNRGVALAALGRYGEALACFDAALAIDPDEARARYNRALARLTVGQYREGWIDYESRWTGGEKPMAPRPFGVPRFTEHDWGKGHRTALWTEQGLGDQLLFSSLATEFEARGEKFVLEVDERLVAAFRRSHPDWEVASPAQSAAAFASCDRALSLASAGGLLRDSEHSFERQPAALLSADASRAAGYAALLRHGPGRPIGISWRSFQPPARRFYEITKSAPLADFQALTRKSDIRLVDLQYGDTAADREAFASNGGRLERIAGLDLFNDIDGVLAAIEACDAVVTISNVTAHLAGAIGKRTLLVYPSANPPFHYWSPNAAGRSRWYPSVEIVTVPGFSSGPQVLGRAAKILG